MVTILNETTKEPITMIGKMAGICWGSDTENPEKNYKRGLSCIEAGHGRTLEYPDVYMSITEHSARVIREWYTHIGGSPTRLQQSTRYIDYSNFDYIIPKAIWDNTQAKKVYMNCMQDIQYSLDRLEEYEIPREDAALLLPLGMRSDIVCKHNARNLIDMSRQRLCNRAYHEYRTLFKELIDALCDYSQEWKTLVDLEFKRKCEVLGYCPEKKSCGYKPKRGE